MYQLNCELSIIVPFFNPPENWEENMFNSIASLKKLIPDTTIKLILINDGSDTYINISNTLKKVVHNFIYINYEDNMGKGYAIRKGMSRSNGDVVLFTDIDFPYMEEDIVTMYHMVLHQNRDIVIGKRNPNYFQKVPLFRKYISKTFSFFIKLLFRIPTSDTQSGLKAFSKKGISLALNTQTNRYLFDLELMILAYRDKSLSVAPIPITLKNNVQLGGLSLKVLISELWNLIKLMYI